MPDKDADEVPISSLVGQRGIKTSKDFADFMAGLMSDIVDGRIKPDVAAAACNAGKELLKLAAMEIEYSGDSCLFERPATMIPDRPQPRQIAERRTVRSIERDEEQESVLRADTLEQEGKER
jgi:hypothetical protein